MYSNFYFTNKINTFLKHAQAFSTNGNENDVIIQNKGNKGVLILNRPKILNALSLFMAKKIYFTLKKWESEKTLVIIKSVGGKAFSVGGDIRKMVERDLKGENLSQEIFKYQYVIKKLVASYKIPYISLIDGAVMGSATGLSFLGQFCVVTERAIFAMPETQIGFIPDGGSSYILPKLHDHLGWYLALTGHRLEGTDIIKSGLTKYYCKRTQFDDLEQTLLCSHKDDSIKSIVENFNTTFNDEFSLKPFMGTINHCFSAKTVEEVIARLQDDNSKWANETINVLNKRCPSSLKITMRELELGKELNVDGCSRMEFRIAINCLKNKNFYEGVRALLIDKDQNPKWEPARLSDVSVEFVESNFSGVPQELELHSKL